MDFSVSSRSSVCGGRGGGGKVLILCNFFFQQTFNRLLAIDGSYVINATFLQCPTLPHYSNTCYIVIVSRISFLFIFLPSFLSPSITASNISFLSPSLSQPYNYLSPLVITFFPFLFSPFSPVSLFFHRHSPSLADVLYRKLQK